MSDPTLDLNPLSSLLPATLTWPDLGAWGASVGLGVFAFLFIFRIVLTWYPQVNSQTFPFSWVYAPTEPFLAPTRRLVPPIGGVDISPIVWVGVISLVREVLLGQQGLITMALR